MYHGAKVQQRRSGGSALGGVTGCRSDNSFPDSYLCSSVLNRWDAAPTALRLSPASVVLSSHTPNSGASALPAVCIRSGASTDPRSADSHGSMGLAWTISASAVISRAAWMIPNGAPSP